MCFSLDDGVKILGIKDLRGVNIIITNCCYFIGHDSTVQCIEIHVIKEQEQGALGEATCSRKASADTGCAMGVLVWELNKPSHPSGRY